MIRVVAIIAWLLLMLIFGIAAVAAERWAVYETSNGKTRVWREGVSEGDTGAIKKSESECRTMLQLAQWSHADDVARHPLPGRSCCVRSRSALRAGCGQGCTGRVRVG
jgi:hypothetical protein